MTNASLPPDHAERISDVDKFVRCPECGSDEATIEVEDVDPWDDSVPTRLRAVCPGCDHTTEWVNL